MCNILYFPVNRDSYIKQRVKSGRLHFDIHIGARTIWLRTKVLVVNETSVYNVARRKQTCSAQFYSVCEEIILEQSLAARVSASLESKPRPSLIIETRLPSFNISVLPYYHKFDVKINCPDALYFEK